MLIRFTACVLFTFVISQQLNDMLREGQLEVDEKGAICKVS